MTQIAAGNGSLGSTSDLLNSPRGIYVDINFNLYVADSGNNRIQLFQSGQLTGTTIVGSTSSTTTITLNGPTGLVLDADNYLFIVDSNNHRIIASGPNGFRCLVGCSETNGSSSSQLFYPQNMAFDSYGNIYVTDRNNNRIQKFILQDNLCSKLFYDRTKLFYCDFS
jgi:sugar lactone lactonase YvrE